MVGLLYISVCYPYLAYNEQDVASFEPRTAGGHTVFVSTKFNVYKSSENEKRKS